MHRLRTLTLGIAATAVASAGLALGGVSGAAAAPQAPSAPAARGATVSTTHTSLGTVIVGPNHHTLYLFEKDGATRKSHCYRSCAGVWAPLITKGAPRAAGKAKASKLGTTRRKNGSRQVTYAGHPVYYYIGDQAAGQTSGEGIKEFGAEWYVVNPKGHKIDNG